MEMLKQVQHDNRDGIAIDFLFAFSYSNCMAGFIKRVFDFVIHPTHARTMGLLIMLVLVATVSLTVAVSQQQQDLRQRASEVDCYITTNWAGYKSGPYNIIYTSGPTFSYGNESGLPAERGLSASNGLLSPGSKVIATTNNTSFSFYNISENDGTFTFQIFADKDAESKIIYASPICSIPKPSAPSPQPTQSANDIYYACLNDCSKKFEDGSLNLEACVNSCDPKSENLKNTTSAPTLAPTITPTPTAAPIAHPVVPTFTPIPTPTAYKGCDPTKYDQSKEYTSTNTACKNPLDCRVKNDFSGKAVCWPANNSITLKTNVCATKQYGDANCDGTINLIDFAIWKNEFTGKTKNIPALADFDLNNLVNIIDYNIWKGSASGR